MLCRDSGSRVYRISPRSNYIPPDKTRICMQEPETIEHICNPECNSHPPKRTYQNHEHDNPCIRPPRDSRQFYHRLFVSLFIVFCIFICLCFLRLLFLFLYLFNFVFFLFVSCVSTALGNGANCQSSGQCIYCPHLHTRSCPC